MAHVAVLPQTITTMCAMSRAGRIDQGSDDPLAGWMKVVHPDWTLTAILVEDG